MNREENKPLSPIIERMSKGFRIDRNLAEGLLYKVLRSVKEDWLVEKVVRETRIPFVTVVSILKTLMDNQLINYPFHDFIDEFHKKFEENRDKLIEFRDKHRTKLEYDQWKCDVETLVRRVEKICDDNYLEGKKILFLGDDDFTSVFLGLAVGHFAEIHVIDIDKDLLDTINKINSDLNLNIKTHHHDLRDPIPEYLRNKFDLFFTDPPFTYNGLSLFLLQGTLALKGKGRGYLCVYPLSLIDDLHKFQRFINDMGYYIDEIIRSFNTYLGTEDDPGLFPSKISDLYVLNRSKEVQVNDEDFEKIDLSGIYTQKT